MPSASWEQTTLSSGRIWPIVAVRPAVEVTPIVGDANQRPAVTRNDDVRTCTENSVDRAALEAELAQVGPAQYSFGLLKSLGEHRLHATIFPVTCCSCVRRSTTSFRPWNARRSPCSGRAQARIPNAGVGPLHRSVT